MVRSLLKLALSTSLLLAAVGLANAQVPGEIYSACTTAGNPLDPNADGFISTTTSGFPVILTDESEDFEGEGWNVVWHLEGEATGDTETGGTCNATEIVDNPNTNEHAAYYRLVDPDNDPSNRNEQLVFRMRIAKHPQGAYGYSILLDTDLQFGSGVDADPNAVSGNPGFELELIWGSGNANGVGVYDVDGTTNGTAIIEYSQNERNQLAYAKYSNCGGEPVFVDFYVDIATFPAGVSATTPLRIVFASASSPSSALGGSASDIGGIDDGTYPDDDLAFTTAVTNTPISTLETGELPAVECNDPTACNYDAAATTDTACTYATTWYADTDNDGAGDPNTTQSACTQPAGYVGVAGDQCPSDANKTEPGLCGCGNVDADVDSDGVCDDSDSCTDLTACNFDDAGNAACTYATTWYADQDGDGVGDASTTQTACSAPEGYVAGPGDQCPNDALKILPGDCGCGTADLDADSDGISDCDDNCTDLTACNFDDAGNAACTYATTWYADADADGFGDAGTTLSACTQPSGYVDNSSDQCDGDASKTEPGLCGCGNVDADVDSDGVCDTDDNCTDLTACNFDDAGNAACTFATTWYADADADGFGDAGTTLSACTQPSGYVDNSSDQCDGDASKTEPGLCGCGNVDADVDSDGVCDTDDNCTDVTANNYNSESNAVCTYSEPSAINSQVADLVEACNGDENVTLDLDNLHSFGAGATYGISTNLSGFASGSLNGSNLTLDFSGEGVGSDTLYVSVQTEGTFTLKIPVSEYGYPYLIEDISVKVASSPRAFDGAILANFANTYGQPITVHLLPFGTLQLVNGAISVPHNRYSIEGYTNSKGCYNPAPAITPTPTPNPTPRTVVVPCLRCSH